MLPFLKDFDSIKKYHDITKSDYESLPFTDKATYLEWRKTWRDAYQTLSEQIRVQKAKRPLKNNDQHDPSAQGYAAWGRQIARAMLEQRKLSKAKAAKLYVRQNKDRPDKEDLIDATAFALATLAGVHA